MKKTFSILAVLVLVVLAIASAMAEAWCTHSWMVVSNTNAGCDFGGKTVKYCIKCGTTETVISAPLGHLWETTSKSLPTFYLEGKEEQRCQRKDCVKKTRTLITPKLKITDKDKEKALRLFGKNKQIDDVDKYPEKFVENIQKYLRKWGYNIKVDGKFGEKTRNAVMSFQQKHKIPKTGIVGEKTALELSCKAK